MEEKATSISEKLENYAVSVTLLCKRMSSDFIDKHFALQLLRSATSAGANYEEGRVAESRKDFIHKLHISLKECKESVFWLKVARKSMLLDEKDFDVVINEAESLSKILAKSIITAKNDK